MQPAEKRICPIKGCGWHMGTLMERVGNGTSKIDDSDGYAVQNPAYMLDSPEINGRTATFFRLQEWLFLLINNR